MKQLSLFLPFTLQQQTAALDALAAQEWGRPDSWCKCDRCQHARDAQAIRGGTMPDEEREQVARLLWDMPGIHQPPPPYIDYDPFEELHRAIYKIRWKNNEQTR